MSALSILVHGPLQASSREQVGTRYVCGNLKIKSEEGGVDITIFTPDAASAERIADAINAAWAVPAKSSEAA